MKSNMKATLQVLMVLFGAGGILAALAGLAGINSSVAFLTSETAFWLYPVVGLMLIGFGDYTRRPTINLARAVKALPARGAVTCPRANVYGVRRRTGVAA